jgi:ligand-binding sensor domain-containing protein/two-component sensor histidine kinase
MTKVFRFSKLLLAFACLSPSLSLTTLALNPDRAITQYIHNSWQTDDGLPQNYVQAIAQTRDGYIWLATQEGLVRFDGISFTVFDKRNTPQLKENNIDALAADREGNLWIGTDGGGLYELKDGRFTVFTNQIGLSDNIVEAIDEDESGTVWIGTLGGLNLLKDGKLTSFTTRDGLPNNNVLAIAKDGKGNIWVGTEGGLCRFNGGKFETYTTAQGLANNLVRAIIEDRDGNLWIATRGGLDRMSGGHFKHYSVRDGLASNSILSICQDRDSNIWIGTTGGLSRLSAGRISSYTTLNGLTNNSVAAITEDREGNIWLGTYGGGLNCLKEGKLVSINMQSGLSDDFTQSIYQDHAGNIWIGTHGGLNRYVDGRLTAYTTRDGLSDNVVLSTCEDHSGNLWIGTSAGLSRLKDGKFTRYTLKDGLSDDDILSIYEDRRGALWIGTSAGLNKLEDGKFTVYTTANGLSNNSVSSVCEDRQGLWIGTDGGGLDRLKDGKFTTYSARDGLSNDTVLSLHLDGEGSLWVGTSGGLNVFKDGRFTSYTTASGLFDDVIFQILEDDHDNLWMSCDKGIFKASKSELADFAGGKIRSITCASYGTADGMKSRECNGGFQPAGCRASDGKLWFPTMKGVVVIDPNNTKTNTQPPPVVIERIVVDGRSITDLNRLRLEAGKEKFEFDYTGLSFLAPRKVRFKYKLEGFDKDWVEADTARKASYTNIPPGSYTFRVKASNNDGVWNETGASVEFYLKPFFYQTLWFYLACSGLVALSALGLYRLRVRRIRAQFAAVLNERNRIAREIHDTLAQGFAGISLQLESVAETMVSAPQTATEHLNKARNLVRSSMAEARRSVLDLRTQALESGNLSTALSAIGQQLSAGVQVQVKVLGRPRTLPETIEKNLLHIGREALTNAVKHAKASRIELEVHFARHQVTLRVADDGFGFDPAVAPAGGGFGLVSMRERARQIGSHLQLVSGPGRGTEIAVSVRC